MENKYYTPKKEEISIGFELEIENLNKEGSGSWCDEKISYGACIDQLFEDDSLDIRVKYLDQKDLLELGWKYEKDNGTYETSVDDVLVLHYFTEGRGWYVGYSENESQFGFGGWVKNKSEMHKLMDMLDIKTQ